MDKNLVCENSCSHSCSHASPNSSTQQTLTELEFERGIWNAVIYNETSRIREFIANGKTMDRDNFGYTALHYAARNGNEEICRLLIRDGRADVNAVTNGGATPLHRAAMMGHLPIVRLLIDSKAHLTVQDEDGQTALHRSALKGDFPVCEFLLDRCNELKMVTDKKGKRPFDLIPMTASDDLKILLRP